MSFAPGEVVGDRWRIDRAVDHGGMGVVHVGTDLVSGARVAIKALLADGERARARFAREVAVLAALDHPAIVRYLDHGVARARPWLAMEWVEGTTLADRIAGRGLTVAEAVTAVRRAAEALGAAHRRGLVHRDVKPRNLLLAGDDPARVLVIDFGVARAADASELTATGAVVGTPAYVAPELARSGGDPDPRADVFALGCVLHECLTGRPAFAGDGAWAVLTRILLDEPTPVRALAPAVPEALAALVTRMLRKDPADRPADGDAVVRALDALPALDAAGPPPVAVGTAPLTDAEQRLIAVVLAAAAPLTWSPSTLVDGETVVTTERGIPGPLVAIAAAHGARLDRLLGGPVALVLDGDGAAHDRAGAAARCALAVRDAWPGAAVALALGYARAHAPVGEAIDRAAAALAAAGDGVVVDDVAAALLEAEFVIDGRALRGPRVRAAPRVLLGRPSPLVGRDRELTMLRAALDAGDDQPAAVLITGPPGAGKSRLLGELLAGRTHVWHARGEAIAAGSALRLALQLVPGLDADAATGDDVRAIAEARRRAFVEHVVAAARRERLVIAIEDLHWGDRASIALLDAALAADAPLAVIATARPEVHDAFPGLWAGCGVQDVRLGPLARRACERLVRGALGDDVDAPVVDRVIAQADGNPLFLEELVRAVAAGATALPGTVLAMAGARLDAIEPELRRVLRAASVLGEQVPAAGVAALLGEPEPAVARALELLVAREVLVVADPERRFRHALLRDAAYASLTDDDRARGHRLAAGWLEPRANADPRVVARHHELAGDPRRAARWWRRAAEAALEGGDVVGAIEAARRGLADDATEELRTIEIEALRWSGDFAATEIAAATALDALPRGGTAWCLAAQESMRACHRTGRRARLLAVAAMVASAGPPSPALVRTAYLAADHLRRVGARTEADALLAQADAAGLDDPMVVAAAGEAHATRARYAGDLAAVRDHTAAALDAYRGAGDRRRALAAAIALADAHLQLDEPAVAAPMLDDALVEAARLGATSLATLARLDLGLARRELDAVIAARDEAAAAGNHDLEGFARTYEADLLLERGRAADARDAAIRAIDLLGHASARAHALAILALARLALGEPDAARAAAVEAGAIADADGVPEGHATILRARAATSTT